MGNPLKEVELAGSKDSDAKPPESAEVPLLSDSTQNDTPDEASKSDQTPASDKESKRLDDNGGDDQAPLLSQQHRSDAAAKGTQMPHANGATTESVQYPPELIKEMESKYAAYVRQDVYGNWGTRSVSLFEKLQLLVALVTICPIRVFLLFAILVLFYVICKLCTLRVTASSSDEGQESFAHMTGIRRTIIVRSGRFLARAMLFMFGFYYIPVENRTSEEMQGLQLGLGDSEESQDGEAKVLDNARPGAIVSNHVSYLDILYHMSASFPSFVAKRSVAKLPLVGLISKCLGCVYVQREYRSSDHKGVSGVVTDRLEAAHNNPNAPGLLLFPEGTTTNGGYLLPFKTGAFRARTPVQPVILKYPFRRFSPAWDTISGARHVVLLMCQYVNHLEVVRLPVYRPTQKECSDPKLYADNVRRLMAAEGDFTMSDIGLYEKRIFHCALQGKPLPPPPAPQGSESK